MIKKKFILASAIVAIAATGYLYFNFDQCNLNQIKVINSYNEVMDILNHVDANTLILFDVDETLIIPRSVSMRTKTKEQHADWLRDTLRKFFKNAPNAEDYYFYDWEISEKPLVIEPIIVDIIKSMQNKNVKVLALTNLPTGSRGRIEFLPQWRFNKLAEVGIDFSKTKFEDTTFTQLPKNDNNYPILYKGILATNRESKGSVLAAFLDYTKWKPNHIIFFDDSLKRVKEVAQEACKRKIKFNGYQYLGAEHIPGELDKNVAQLQFKHLLTNEKWLSDEQARELLKFNN